MQENAWIFLIDLFKYCPRKFEQFVQSLNWTWTILGLSKIGLRFTPLVTTSAVKYESKLDSESVEVGVLARVGVEAGFGVGRSRQFFLESESE